MSEKTILSVGYDIPGNSRNYLPFDSDRSLLDGDIIVFAPSLKAYRSSSYYLGKRRLIDYDSPKALEQCRRWKQELSEVLNSGRNVIIFLSEYEEVYIHMGQKNLSGTGRNQKVTLVVDPLNNYCSIPIDLGTIIPKGGREIRPASGNNILSSFWSEFGEVSQYNLYLKNPKGTPLLTAKTHDAIVGFITRVGNGNVILLPPPKFEEKEFTRKNKKGEEFWNKKGLEFGNKLISAIVELDRKLRSEAEITPAPEWSTSVEYKIPGEENICEQINYINHQISQLQDELDSLKTNLIQIGLLRDLLLETGKPLEHAIIRALISLGFTALPFNESGSEFDVVFSSSEGRFLGEAEGKNDKAIGIEKMDQLERNIREDFERQDNGKYAKGVLFGNAYRLRSPNERPEYFTQKCCQAALRSKVALIRTPDLFEIARYLESKPDMHFASQCRLAILNTEGAVVIFPKIPFEE